MAGKQNCWEKLNCGRQEGGAKVLELGVCPANTDKQANGLNGGINGGRICWAVAGTLCGGEIQGTEADKVFTCLSCSFHNQVKMEEGESFTMLKPGQEYKRGYHK